MTGTLHVVGAGLAGLSAALHAQAQGREVKLYEGAGQAGGRCRSYHDSRLDRVIDNGNHLVLTGNTSVQAYLALAKVPDALEAAPAADFPFVDLATGERWVVRMNDGPIPWWPMASHRRPLGVGLLSMIRAGMILLAGPQHTISALCGGEGYAHSRFWEPMSMAVMNLPPDKASAQLMRATALEAWRDGKLARPMFAPRGLGAALVEPALNALEERGTPALYGHLLRRVETAGTRITKLLFSRGDTIDVAADDDVILALPPHRLAGILPEIEVPEDASSILNAHFVVGAANLPDGAPKILGTVSSMTQWIFVKGDVVSLTISAAEYVEGSEDQEEALLARLWSETKQALGLAPELSFQAGRLVREKKATFLQTPHNAARRPKQITPLQNLFLAGDFVDTGLPATIESAVRSGERAARLAA
ncbi:MAG: hydroxysqualene dehydroxylase HpnE [Pseudomonadota bacterium]